ncbi:unnamed protein product [Penicillium viridicatum]
MAAEQKTIRTRHSNSLKSSRQKQARRRNSLLRKSFEHYREYDTDVFIMMRLKRNGQILFFNSYTQWPLSRQQLLADRRRPRTTQCRER